MEFGLNKCAKATFKRGKKVSAEGILLDDQPRYGGRRSTTAPDEGQDQEEIQAVDQTGSQL